MVHQYAILKYEYGVCHMLLALLFIPHGSYSYGQWVTFGLEERPSLKKGIWDLHHNQLDPGSIFYGL